MGDEHGRPLAIATWTHIRAPDERRDLTVRWSALAARLTAERPRPTTKMDLPVWSPVAYRDGHKGRGNAGVLSLSALVLDYDQGDVDAAIARWAQYRMAWHTSWSSTREVMRARVVLPLAQPHPAEHWSAVWAWLRSSGVEADRACSDVARAYYVGCPGADGDWRAGVVDGELLDVSHLRVLPKPARVVRPVRWRSTGHMLAAEPEARRRLGERLGAEITDTRVRRAVCPQCGRASAWWWIEPERMTGWKCDHENTCGGFGRLGDYVDGV